MRARRHMRLRRRKYGRSEGGGFASWAEVMAAAKAGQDLFYKAPMDRYAHRFVAQSGGAAPFTYKAKGRTIRMWPSGSVGRGRWRTSDPFTANSGHLDRFLRSHTGV